MKCRYCNGINTVKRGMRRNKYHSNTVYYCKDCSRKFSAAALKKVYPSPVIFDALGFYNLGYGLADSAKIVFRKDKTQVSKSILGEWVNEFKGMLRYSEIRPEVLKRFTPSEVVESKLFRHKGLTYNFKIHKGKLDLCGIPELNEYFLLIKSDFPHSYFEKDMRCSSLKFNFELDVFKKKDYVCSLAQLFLEGVINNKKRHDAVERNFLVNDLSTVAVEVPVWHYDKMIGGVCGHIDILQVRHGMVYILDYKPNAACDKSAFSQLYLYAVGLSFRTKIDLKNIRCAWFDSDDYFEFSPSEFNVDYFRKQIARKSFYSKSSKDSCMCKDNGLHDDENPGNNQRCSLSNYSNANAWNAQNAGKHHASWTGKCHASYVPKTGKCRVPRDGNAGLEEWTAASTENYYTWS